MFNLQDLKIPAQNMDRYTLPITYIYEQTQALETIVNFIKDQPDLAEYYKKYKTVNPQQLAYYIAKNGDMQLSAKRVISDEIVEFTKIVFDDKLLESFWALIKDQDPLIQ